jgi:hypothetical protein
MKASAELALVENGDYPPRFLSSSSLATAPSGAKPDLWPAGDPRHSRRDSSGARCSWQRHSELANYYRNTVIGGAGAFVAVAENFTFDNAITKTLIAEIAQAEPQLHCRRHCSHAPLSVCGLKCCAQGDSNPQGMAFKGFRSCVRRQPLPKGP